VLAWWQHASGEAVRAFSLVECDADRIASMRTYFHSPEAITEVCRELGLPCRDVVSGPTGLRQVFVKDPDGNMVEFIGPTKSPSAVRRMER